MSAPARDDAPNGLRGPATTPTVHRRRGGFLIAVAVWNLWLWITRIVNLVQDPTPRTTGFIAVHAVLYGTSILIALAVGALGWRMWREARTDR